MNSRDLKNVLKSIECCAATEEDACDECPYNNDHDNAWHCMDRRYEDLKKILDWGIETMETLENFFDK